MKFAVGEIAIYVGDSSICPRGTEVEIKSEERSNREDGRIGYSVYVPGLRRSWSPDGYWFAETCELRKKPPKQEPGSWDEIEKLTNWNPTKVIA